ncbi:hypothetical protein [Echinimonas agarilytica]|uniref:Uncharacterized protein n=1 Tax=Echinimonas agarilytica TaxID=1215918 RepID=A0AA41W8U1_9GAMM|nr:hypothetical protein [Echinimonas agarilytica]MCM2681184.1 hypothetical protein [Echinimonas agarilytica]
MQSEYCLNNKLECVARDQPNVVIMLQQSIKLEQPISFEIQFPEDWNLAEFDGRLVGANMYMGRIPVTLIQSSSNNLSGEMIVVACTHANMVWKLEVEVLLDNGQRKVIHWPFAMND